MSGGSDLHAQPLRFLAEDVEPVGVADIERHRGGEEFDRIIRLQIGGLIGDLGIGRGMALVEAVAGEFLRLLENLFGDRSAGCRFSPAPLMNFSRCVAISDGIFLPMARRRRSASPMRVAGQARGRCA